MNWQNELRKVKYVGRTGEKYLIPFIADLLKKQNAELLEACEGVLELIDEGILVRDTSKDDDFSYFTKQGLRITKYLLKAKQAIKKAKGE